jgi:hypothetical protein
MALQATAIRTHWLSNDNAGIPTDEKEAEEQGFLLGPCLDVCNLKQENMVMSPVRLEPKNDALMSASSNCKRTQHSSERTPHVNKPANVWQWYTRKLVYS